MPVLRLHLPSILHHLHQGFVPLLRTDSVVSDEMEVSEQECTRGSDEVQDDEAFEEGGQGGDWYCSQDVGENGNSGSQITHTGK